MKKLSMYTAALLLLVTAACQREDLSDPVLTDSTDHTLESKRGGSAGFTTPNNQMVVRYDAGISEADKAALRNSYQVQEVKTCPCADPNLELWIFDFSGSSFPELELEQKLLASAKDTSELEGVDFNPIFQHGGQKLASVFGGSDIVSALSKQVNTNTGVTIAILDTGVDYNYFGFNDTFLYNNPDGDTCNDVQTDYYGWDFVNDDNDPHDDYGHGTIISHIVFEQLKSQNVDFQILPVKAFDHNGQGNYFDILCGFKYALNNPDVDIINMSFGWYLNDYELFKSFISESEDRVLLTTSAGNSRINTDYEPHYPSGYPFENIVATAALDQYDINLAPWSNFGQSSVDLAAPGTNLPFQISSAEYITVSGTSFSNAYMAAKAGSLHYESLLPTQLKELVINASIYNNNLQAINYSSYVYY